MIFPVILKFLQKFILANLWEILLELLAKFLHELLLKCRLKFLQRILQESFMDCFKNSFKSFLRNSFRDSFSNPFKDFSRDFSMWGFPEILSSWNPSFQGIPEEFSNKLVRNCEGISTKQKVAEKIHNEHSMELPRVLLNVLPKQLQAEIAQGMLKK